ncbi:hypothetical protein C2S51_015157 [Perilla frutescens var. frutescens]|nr:hypothetical protein C2S51_015157 [Perilla frutescens var. frutescens]
MDMSTYIDILIGNAKLFLQELKNEGARNVAVVGVSKIGCVPLVVTSDAIFGDRMCNETLSAVAAKFNQRLLKVLEPMKSPNFRVVYADLYKPLENIINNPSKFGFGNVDSGCCGTGFLEVTFLCNPTTHVCNNPSKYAFFDSVHPSEASYKQIFKELRPTIDEAIKKFSR